MIASQLLLGFAEPAPSADTSHRSEDDAGEEAARLAARLRVAGLPAGTPIRTHANRSVMVGYHPLKGLRIHRGYAHAPDEVIQAIVQYLRPGLRRHARLEARQAFIDFPVHRFVPVRPPRRVAESALPGDQVTLDRLQDLHRRLNARRFGGTLRPIGFRLSSRMRKRLGELRVDSVTGVAEIGISRRHLRRDGWSSVEHTVLHEMVHQWQLETGRPLAHDAEFRQKAGEVGIDGAAVWRPSRVD